MATYSLNDSGVVLYLTGDGTTNGTGAGVVNDKRGVVVVPGTLVAAYVAGSTIQVGARGALALYLKLRMHTATSITIKVTGQRYDALNNPALWGPALIQTVAPDDGSAAHLSTTAAEQVFTTANIGVDTTFNVVLQTTSQFLAGDVIVSAHANAGSLSANDYVIVGINAA